VGNNPDSVSAVRGTDTASWNNKRPRGVAEALQVKKHIVECQFDDSSNVLSNDPSGSHPLNNLPHVRPEVTVILRASLLPGDTERLAREASADEIDRAALMEDLRSAESSDISINRDF
jgi:hypothetical protein